MTTALKKNFALYVCSIAIAFTTVGCNTKAKNPTLGQASLSSASSLSPAAAQGVVVKSESQQCTENFELLKKLDAPSFEIYRAQFDRINKQYTYYRENEKFMENDPKEVMTITLNDKLNMVCDRVKSQTYIEIRSRMKSISKI
ncbi:hypothetical protein [Citrobacter werkmanii]|uniref:hypothetical protein n=1 Tax=Citrobacter werkmanii TaxID=67827 RepID=UPI002F35E625